MKRIRLLLFWIVLISAGYSQNLQIHYDFGQGRHYYTTTLEMYKPDRFGSTFWFADFDYDAPGNHSLSLAYWEIARYISIPGQDKWLATIQFNDGTAPWGNLGQVWLAGCRFLLPVRKTVIPVDFLLRSMDGSGFPDGQITLVWQLPFGSDRWNFTGFLDVWTQDHWGSDEKMIVVLTEPQIWVRVWEQLSMGGELEISYHFLQTEKVEWMPTIGLRWDFE